MSDKNVAFVKGLYEAFGRGDFAGIGAACAADVRWEIQGQPRHFPVLGEHSGPDRVVAFLKDTGDHLTFTEFMPDEFHASGDKVFVLGHYKANIKKTGKPFSSRWVHVFTLSGGKVADFIEFTDTASLAEAYRA